MSVCLRESQSRLKGRSVILLCKVEKGEPGALGDLFVTILALEVAFAAELAAGCIVTW